MAKIIEVPVSQIAEINRGASVSPSEIKVRTVMEDTGIQYLSVSNIQNNYIESNEMPYLKNIEDREYKYLVKENDIVLTKMGEPKFAFVNNLESKKIIVSQNLYILRFNERVHPLYIRAFFESELGYERLEKACIRNTIATLPVKNLEQVMVPLFEDEDENQKKQAAFVKKYEEEEKKRMELLKQYMSQSRKQRRLFDEMMKGWRE
jgi:type I restriction enzyme M protein